MNYNINDQVTILPHGKRVLKPTNGFIWFKHPDVVPYEYEVSIEDAPYVLHIKEKYLIPYDPYLDIKEIP